MNIFKIVRDHPFLWSVNKKINFICEFSNYIETYFDPIKVEKMEEYVKNNAIIHKPWIRRLHPNFVIYFIFRKKK